MRESPALGSSVGGIAIGSLIAGVLWWMDVPLVLMSGAGVVWAVAFALTIYIDQSYPDGNQSGPWGAVVGGSLMFGVLINLSDITISTSDSAALTVLAIGFTLLGYSAGMAAVRSQDSTEVEPDRVPTDT